jgi:hypothetical protein
MSASHPKADVTCLWVAGKEEVFIALAEATFYELPPIAKP